jgi:uroporphyrinogen-III synthase
MDQPNPLRGRRIVVPESRELDLFVRMLEAQGAEALRCPMVTILDAEDPAPIAAWLKRMAAGELDDLILLTGEGLRRLLAVARQVAIDNEVVAALKQLRPSRPRPESSRPSRARLLRTEKSACSSTPATPTSRS